MKQRRPIQLPVRLENLCSGTVYAGRPTGRLSTDNPVPLSARRRSLTSAGYPATQSLHRAAFAARFNYANDAASTRTPGPIVVDNVTFLKYTPFEVAGLDLPKAATRARKFSFSASASNDALPIEQ